MLSQLCLPSSTSFIPSTSGGLRASVTKTLKHKEDKYSGAHGSCRVHHWCFPKTSLLEKQVRGHHAGNVSSDEWIRILV